MKLENATSAARGARIPRKWGKEARLGMTSWKSQEVVEMAIFLFCHVERSEVQSKHLGA